MTNEELLAHPLAVRVLDTFGPRLNAMASNLRDRFPVAKFFVRQDSVGSRTSFQAVDLSIDAVFPRYVPGASDGCSISITLCHLDGKPRIQAGVDWASRDGDERSEADSQEKWDDPEDFAPEAPSSDDWPEATPEMLARLERDFDRLARGFEDSVVRACHLLRDA